MRRSSYFINQSPSDDEHFPYWTPDDYLVRKFELGNAGIRQLLAARTSLPNYSRRSTDHSLMKAIERFNRDEEAIVRSSRYARTEASGLPRQYAVLGRRQWMEVSAELHRDLSPSQCEQRYIQLLEASRDFLKGTVVYLKHEPDPSALPPSKRHRAASAAPAVASLDYSGIDSSKLRVSGVEGVKRMRFIAGNMLFVMTRKPPRRIFPAQPTRNPKDRDSAKAKPAPDVREERKVKLKMGRAATCRDFESYGSEHSSDLSSDDSFFYTSSEDETCSRFATRRKPKTSLARSAAVEETTAIEITAAEVTMGGQTAAQDRSGTAPSPVHENGAESAENGASSSRAVEEAEVVDLSAQDQELYVDLCSSDADEDSDFADDEGISSDDASASSSETSDSDSDSDSDSTSASDGDISVSSSDGSLSSASSCRSAHSEALLPDAKRQRLCPSPTETVCSVATLSNSAAEGSTTDAMEVEDSGGGRGAELEAAAEQAPAADGAACGDREISTSTQLDVRCPLDDATEVQADAGQSSMATCPPAQETPGDFSGGAAEPAVFTSEPTFDDSVVPNASERCTLVPEAEGKTESLTADELALLVDLLPEGAYSKSTIGWHAVARRVGRNVQCVYTAAKRLRAQYRAQLLERKLRRRTSEVAAEAADGVVERKRCYVSRPTESYDPRSIRVPKSRFQLSAGGKKRKSTASPESGAFGHALLQGFADHAVPSSDSLVNIFKRAAKEPARAKGKKQAESLTPVDTSFSNFHILPGRSSPAPRVPTLVSCATMDERLRRALMMLFALDLTKAGQFSKLMKLQPDIRPQLLKNEKWCAIALHLAAPIAACWERLGELGRRRGFSITTEIEEGRMVDAAAEMTVAATVEQAMSVSPMGDSVGVIQVETDADVVTEQTPVPHGSMPGGEGSQSAGPEQPPAESPPSAQEAQSMVEAQRSDAVGNADVIEAVDNTEPAETAQVAESLPPAVGSAVAETAESAQKEAWWSLTPTLIPFASGATKQTFPELEASVNYAQRAASFGKLFEAAALRQNTIEAFFWLECTEAMIARQPIADNAKLEASWLKVCQRPDLHRSLECEELHALWVAVGREMNAFSFDCRRAYEAILRQREQERKERLRVEKLAQEQRLQELLQHRLERVEVDEPDEDPTANSAPQNSGLVLTRDLLFRWALSILFSCQINDKLACAGVRNQSAPGRAGSAADTRWTAIALYLRTTVEACWQRFLTLAAMQPANPQPSQLHANKSAALPAVARSTAGESPSWWASVPDHRIRYAADGAEPQIPMELYAPTPEGTARPPLPLHATTLELLHKLHAGGNVTTQQLPPREHLLACVEKIFHINRSAAADCQRVLNLNSTYREWLAIARVLESRTYTCCREFARLSLQQGVIQTDHYRAVCGEIERPPGANKGRPPAAASALHERNSLPAAHSISSSRPREVLRVQPQAPVVVPVEPNNSAAILLAEHNATLRRTQGKEHLIQLMNSYATRYQVQHGRRLTETSPPWDDAYLDEVLVRAAWVQFDQGGQSSQSGDSVVDAATRWVNVAALVDHGASECMLRYIQLSIAQAQMSQQDFNSQEPARGEPLLATRSAATSGSPQVVSTGYGGMLVTSGHPILGSSLGACSGEVQVMAPRPTLGLALSQTEATSVHGSSSTNGVAAEQVHRVPNLEKPLPPFVIVEWRTGTLAVRGLDFELVRCAKALLPNNYEAIALLLQGGRMDVRTAFTAMSLHLNLGFDQCVKRHCELRNWRLRSLRCIFDGDRNFQSSGRVPWDGDRAPHAYLISHFTLESLKRLGGAQASAGFANAVQFKERLCGAVLRHGLGNMTFAKCSDFQVTYARWALVAREMQCSVIDCVRQYAVVVSELRRAKAAGHKVTANSAPQHSAAQPGNMSGAPVARPQWTQLSPHQPTMVLSRPTEAVPGLVGSMSPVLPSTGQGLTASQLTEIFLEAAGEPGSPSPAETRHIPNSQDAIFGSSCLAQTMPAPIPVAMTEILQAAVGIHSSEIDFRCVTSPTESTSAPAVSEPTSGPAAVGNADHVPITLSDSNIPARSNSVPAALVDGYW